MKNFVFGVLVLINVFANAQINSVILDTVISGDIEYYSIINGDTIIQKKVNKSLRRKRADNKLSYVYINGRAIDSTGINFSFYPFLIGNELNPIGKTLSKHQITIDGYNNDLNKNYDFPKVAGIHYEKNRLNHYYLSVTFDNKNVVPPLPQVCNLWP